MNPRVKVYGFLAVLVLAGAGVWVYKTKPQWIGVAKATSKGPEKKDSKEKEPTPVQLVTAVRGEMSAFLVSTANLRALRDVAVATQVEGIVEKVQAEEGDFVKEGQVLASLDETQLRLRVELARQKLAQAKLQMEKAAIRQEKTSAQIGHTSAELVRYQKAHKEGLVSEKEVAAYQYKLEELQHDQRVSSSETRELQHRVSELEAEIAQANLEISRTQIRAPYSGYITQRMVNLGQRVRAMDALFNIGSFTPLYADVFLSEREARSVHPNQAANIKLGADESQSVKGTVERISPIVDQATGTIKVTVQLTPAAGFRPGAFVRVEIRTDTKNDAVLIPKKAILEEDGQNFVYVAGTDTARRVKVSTGYERDGMIEIRSGVVPGQKIVVAGQGALKEGAKIKVMQG